MEYEYRYLSLACHTKFEIQELLNSYGKKGWHVIHMTDDIIWLERIKKPQWIER